jgi:hypothetical protein
MAGETIEGCDNSNRTGWGRRGDDEQLEPEEQRIGAGGAHQAPSVVSRTEP